jgi:O-antigen ligase
LVLMSVATILTGSRGGVLSFTATAAFALMLTFAFKENKGSAGKISSKLTVWLLPAIGLSLAILIAMLLVIALGGEQNLLRGTGLRNAQTDFTSGRAGFWKVAWQIFLSHPILGAGLDAFGAAFTKFDPSSGLFRVEQAHNDYLQMLADGGIAAFACVIAFIYLLFRNGIRRIRDGLGSLDKSIVIGALAGCFGIMVHSLMDFPLRTPANAFFFLTLVSMAAAKVSPEKSSYSSEIR